MIPVTSAPTGDTPALIVVDVQQEASDRSDGMHSGSGSVPGGRGTIIENINMVVSHAREADVPIVWGKELHRPDFADYGAELESCEPEHGLYGTTAERLDERLAVNELDMKPAEYVVSKRRYNFFHRTDMEHLLSTYNVDTVVLVGFMTHVCVQYTAHGAHERDYAFRVVEEGTGAPTADLHDIGLRCLRYLQPRGVRSLNAVIEGFDAYEGNPIVQRVKDTGQVHSDTGPVMYLE